MLSLWPDLSGAHPARWAEITGGRQVEGRRYLNRLLQKGMWRKKNRKRSMDRHTPLSSPYSSVCLAMRIAWDLTEVISSGSEKKNGRFEKGREINGAKEPATFTKSNKRTSTKPIRSRVKSSSKGRRRILLKKKKRKKKKEKNQFSSEAKKKIKIHKRHVSFFCFVFSVKTSKFFFLNATATAAVIRSCDIGQFWTYAIRSPFCFWHDPVGIAL